MAVPKGGLEACGWSQVAEITAGPSDRQRAGPCVPSHRALLQRHEVMCGRSCVRLPFPLPVVRAPRPLCL